MLQAALQVTGRALTVVSVVVGLALALAAIGLILTLCACIISSLQGFVSRNDAQLHQFQQLVDVEKGHSPPRSIPKVPTGATGLRDFWNNISEEEAIRSRALLIERRGAPSTPVI